MKMNTNCLFLVTMYKGIGDAVLVRLSFVDQIIKEEPQAFGKIDILCNSVQAEIFEHDPRVNRIILTNNSLFSLSEMTMWLNGIRLDAKTAALIHFLGNKSVMADMSGDIPLYMSSEQVKNARVVVRNIKERSKVSPESSKLMVVASDTTSVITRPPVDLLATSIAEALRNCPDLIVCILQGYTDASAAQNLCKILTGEFEGRIFLMPAEPKAKLLDVVAFIDQSDMFITGDTGLMHLAAATKKLKDGDDATYYPNNSVKIIAVFGGTNPSFYGYSTQTIIVGKGRKEQMAFIPGIAKESYDPKGKNLFDHISPHQLTEAILS